MAISAATTTRSRSAAFAASTSSSSETPPICVSGVVLHARRLQRLEILDQIVAFLVRELPADDAVRIGLLVGIRRRLKGMAEHAVALDFLAVAVRRREQGLPRPARGFTGSKHCEADLFRVEVARAQAELFW